MIFTTNSDDECQCVEEVARRMRVLTRIKAVAGTRARTILDLPVRVNQNLRRTYGVFRFSPSEIELAPWLQNDREQLQDTFLHEVAHAICFFSGARSERHGVKWKEVARSLGATPKACGTVAVNGQAAYRPRKEKPIGVCASCGHVFLGRKALARNLDWSCLMQECEDNTVYHAAVQPVGGVRDVGATGPDVARYSNSAHVVFGEDEEQEEAHESWDEWEDEWDDEY